MEYTNFDKEVSTFGNNEKDLEQVALVWKTLNSQHKLLTFITYSLPFASTIYAQ